MRIGLIQLNAKIGDFKNNLLKIQSLALLEEADLYICPELSLCGYHCRDLFTRREFLEADQAALLELVSWSKEHKKSLWVGHLFKEDTKNGSMLFNAASFVSLGKILQTVKKRKLPNYNIFEEKRFFEPSTQELSTISFMGRKIFTEICEDSWETIKKFSKDEPFTYNSEDRPDCDLLVNLSASPYSTEKPETRRKLLSDLSKNQNTLLAYSNFCGAQDEIIFDGRSSVYDQNGHCLFEAPAFEEGVFVVDTSSKKATKSSLSKDQDSYELWNDLHLSITTFIKDYVKKSGFQKVILGLSGGIDSALVATLCVDALGPENVKGVGLASEWTSELSISEAKTLSENLKIEFINLNIKNQVESVRSLFSSNLASLAGENLQSRLRGLTLMTMANDQNSLLVATSNKSEIAMGYSTLYGDMCGAIMPIGDLYKTEVYGLSHFINLKAGYDLIPFKTLQRAPTAELAPGQKDSDSLPEYSKLDVFLETFIENRDLYSSMQTSWNHFLNPFSSEKLIRQIHLNEFKRAQSPLIAKVHHRSFGKHWNMPITKLIGLPKLT